MARGNITGLSLLAYLLDAKRIKLLPELIPSAATFAVLLNLKNAQSETQLRDFQVATRALGLGEVAPEASAEQELGTAFARLVQERGGALVASADAIFLSRRDQIIALAAHPRAPSTYEWHEFTNGV